MSEKRREQKRQGRCLACGVVGQRENDFICENCGHSRKTMVVCSQCKKRTDLTLVGPTMIKEFFAKIDPSIEWTVVADKNISRGTTIVVSVCSSCRGKKKLPVGKTLIYKIRKEERR